MRVKDNAVRLALFVLAYNLGHFLGRLVLPNGMARWSLTTLRQSCERWWAFCQLGMDGDGYQHYWIDIDVENGTWQPTGLRPNDSPPFPGTFGAYYSDVRWSDQLYRIMTGAFTVVEHCPELREDTLAWIRDILSKTNGRRLRWMIDLDGRQLKPDVRWMECMLSSEAPFHYLTAYWRGRKEGWWH